MAPMRWRPNAPMDLLLRPDDIMHDDASPWRAEVVAKAFRGAEFLYTLKLATGHARAFARAVASQSRDRRAHRHPPRDRSRRGVCGVRVRRSAGTEVERAEGGESEIDLPGVREAKNIADGTRLGAEGALSVVQLLFQRGVEQSGSSSGS